MISLLFLTQKIFADELNFSINPILPKNQAQSASYFDLLMKPGEMENVEVQVMNLTNKRLIIEESVASATTNLNGAVDYSPNTIKPDPSLKYNIKDYIVAPRKISLLPKETKNVSINVKMPASVFQGTIAGGLTYQEVGGTAPKVKNNGVSVINKYAFAVAILLQQNKMKLAPNLVMKAVFPGQVNYRNVINANLQNPAATYLNTMYARAEVKGISNKKIEYTSTKEMMQMAPNTNFDYPIALGKGNKLEPGKYNLSMTVYGQIDSTNGKYTMINSSGEKLNFDYKWMFTRNFTISAAKAKALNAKDVTLKVKGTHFISWPVLLGGLFILMVFIILLLRRFNEVKLVLFDGNTNEPISVNDQRVTSMIVNKETELTPIAGFVVFTVKRRKKEVKFAHIEINYYYLLEGKRVLKKFINKKK